MSKNIILLIVFISIIFVSCGDNKSVKILNSYKEKKIFFENFSQIKTLVTSIIETKTGTIYISTFDGLYKYENNNLIKIDLINKDDNEIKIFKGKSFLALYYDEKNNIIYTIAIDKTNKYKVLKIVNTNEYSIIDLDKKFDKYIFISLCLDSKNGLWLGTWGNGVVYKKADNSIIEINSKSDKYEIDDDYILDIEQTYQGSKEIIWIGTKNKGLFSVDENFNISIYNEHSSDIINNSVYTIAHKNNILWIGTWGGVSKLENGEWTNYTKYKNTLSENFVKAIDIYNDEVWFGTDNSGITCYNGQIWKTFDIKNGLLSNKVYSIKATKNYVWIGTDIGLSRFDKSFF